MAVHVATLLLLTHAAAGQGAAPSHESSAPIFKSNSTLVIVPTLVRSVAGEIVQDLDAGHFRLTDNGVEQKVFVEQAENEPLAIVVVMQTSGAVSSQLQSYSKLDTMIEDMLGSSTSKVALVTFGSHPEEIWNFPPNVDALYFFLTHPNYFLTHPQGGAHDAAIVDAVNCAIGLLQQQPATFRRVILLLSQEQDDGSGAHPEDLLRGLAESGTTIYSLTFSPEKARLKAQLPKHHGKASSNQTYPMLPL